MKELLDEIFEMKKEKTKGDLMKTSDILRTTSKLKLDIEEFRSIIWSNPTTDTFMQSMNAIIDFYPKTRGDLNNRL